MRQFYILRAAGRTMIAVAVVSALGSCREARHNQNRMRLENASPRDSETRSISITTQDEAILVAMDYLRQQKGGLYPDYDARAWQLGNGNWRVHVTEKPAAPGGFCFVEISENGAVLDVIWGR